MLILRFRNWLWHYPEMLFFGDRSIMAGLIRFYKNGAPFTTALLISLLILGGFYLALLNASNLFINNNILIEGVVVGLDEDTNSLIQINKISPLTSSSNKSRLEKDLIELIYEGLIRVNQKGESQPLLGDYVEEEPGRKYQFKLKDNIYWHDGVAITAQDVEATFNLLKELEKNPQTSTMYSKAATQIDLIKSTTDPKAFEFVVKGNNIIPGFLEAVSFKILPAHMLNDVTPDNINLPDPLINRLPVGSGRYKFYGKNNDSLDLVRNELYYGTKPQIEKIRFKFFASEQSAVEAIKTGQIHTLVSNSINVLSSIKNYGNLAVAKSNTLYNQYWAIYFNMGEGANPVLKSTKVRQAIARAINKSELTNDVLQGYVTVADGPIPPISFAYNNQYVFTFDLDKARELLEGDGWKLEPGKQYRSKEGVTLSFRLVLLNNADRLKIAEKIKEQLAKVGIQMEIDIQSTADITNTVISRTFEAIYYGTQTFIDPDRYELFHSSQIKHPGLNVASWSSSEITQVIRNGKKEKIPESDDVLDLGRRIVVIEERKKLYKDLQRLMANDQPIIFLYYPSETYIYNRRLNKIVLEDLNGIEQRFINIDKWSITS